MLLLFLFVLLLSFVFFLFCFSFLVFFCFLFFFLLLFFLGDSNMISIGTVESRYYVIIIPVNLGKP